MMIKAELQPVTLPIECCHDEAELQAVTSPIECCHEMGTHCKGNMYMVINAEDFIKCGWPTSQMSDLLVKWSDSFGRKQQ